MTRHKPSQIPPQKSPVHPVVSLIWPSDGGSQAAAYPKVTRCVIKTDLHPAAQALKVIDAEAAAKARVQ
jgi:hypothetical protein